MLTASIRSASLGQRGCSCSATLCICHRPRTGGGQWFILARVGAVGLVESLPDCFGDDSVLATGQVRQGAAHPVNASPLLFSVADPTDRLWASPSKIGAMAALRPVCASLITSRTPPRPRAFSGRRNSVQKGKRDQ